MCINKLVFKSLFAYAILVSCGKEEAITVDYTAPCQDLIGFHVVVDDNVFYPVDTTGHDLTVFVPEGSNLSGKIVFLNSSQYVSINGLPFSEDSVYDFSDYKNGIELIVAPETDEKKTYSIRVLDTHLPTMSVTTQNHEEILDKVNWKQAQMKVILDGTSRDYEIEVRGRGNQTWVYPKKPYALKLKKKEDLLGMPKHKRWVLLALYRGFIGHAFAFEATRRAPSIDWAPRGQFVEMVLNGKYQGLYYLCEQIKIDKERIDIAELKADDEDYPAISGGYLLECDELFDEDVKFRSAYYNRPYQLKSKVTEAQFNYIRDFINDMESEILKIGTDTVSHYGDYIDVENFADYWMTLEMVNNYEAFKPRSVKLYKGRDGIDSPVGTVCKLKAGPLWDQEVLLMNYDLYSTYAMYYSKLFQDPFFVSLVKKRWETYMSNICGNDEYISLLYYTTLIYNDIKRSADRDVDFWDNTYFTLDQEYENVASRIDSRIDWMDKVIKNM